MKKILTTLFFTFTVNSATFQFNWGAGFNDTTPVLPIDGNSGTTLGDQRQILFQAVGDYWGSYILSNVNIVVDAAFVPQLCMPNSAVLGSAGPSSFHSGFPGQPIPNTFYPRALIDAIRGVDNNPGQSDITANFNSNIDTGCFNGGTYYYGINGSAPPNKVQLYSTVLHEFAHGLGFVSLASYNDGSYFSNIPSVFDLDIFDTEANMPWDAMTDSQRFASMTNDPNLIWNGDNVTDNAANHITSGFNSGKVRLQAPGSLAPGSSVSHFSDAATPDLLMESFLGNIDFNQVDLTPYIMQDIGYEILSPDELPIFKNGFE